MPVNISFHLYSKGGEGSGLTTSSRIQHINGAETARSAFVEMLAGMESVKIFFDNVEDIERIAFEFTTLAMEARSQWGLDDTTAENENK